MIRRREHNANFLGSGGIYVHTYIWEGNFVLRSVGNSLEAIGFLEIEADH